MLLMACSESRRPQPSTVDNDGIEKEYDREKADSVCEDIIEKAKEDVKTEEKHLRNLFQDPQALTRLRREIMMSLNMTICGASIPPLRMICQTMA